MLGAITLQENALLVYKDEILDGFGSVTHKMLLQIPNAGFAKAPVAVDGVLWGSLSVVWTFMGFLE